jgi:long-chain acyl-CoA synthetase
MTLLLTGATGFVGMELLARLVNAPAACATPVVALIRAEDDAHATRRLHETLSVFGAVEPYAQRVTAVAGDLERPGLGIDPRLARSVSEIVHGAASVSFELGLDRSRAINVEGTRRVLAFAARCPRLRRLTYVSTAYVAGEHRGVFAEDDYDLGQRFRNPYERSKFEAEGLVRAASAAGLPVRSCGRASSSATATAAGPRRSTSCTGRCARSRRAPTRSCRRVATRPSTSFRSTTSPTRSARCTACRPRPAARSHPPHPSTRAASASCSTSPSGASAAGARRSCRPRVVHPLASRFGPARRRRFLRATSTYLPYFAMHVRYDDARARAALGAAIAPAPLDTYFDRLVDYALLACWGARPIGRAGALDALPLRHSGAAQLAGV